MDKPCVNLRDAYKTVESDSENEKLTEEYIIKNIPVSYLNLLGFDVGETNIIRSRIIEGKSHTNTYKKALFMAILETIHKELEGDRKFKSGEKNHYFNYLVNRKEIGTSWTDNIQDNPDCFYFSSSDNRNEALTILKSFFGINILNWWYDV